MYTPWYIGEPVPLTMFPDCTHVLAVITSSSDDVINVALRNRPPATAYRPLCENVQKMKHKTNKNAPACNLKPHLCGSN